MQHAFSSMGFELHSASLAFEMWKKTDDWRGMVLSIVFLSVNDKRREYIGHHVTDTASLNPLLVVCLWNGKMKQQLNGISSIYSDNTLYEHYAPVRAGKFHIWSMKMLKTVQQV